MSLKSQVTGETLRTPSAASIIDPGQTLSSITDTVSEAVLSPGFRPGWWLLLAIGCSLIGLLCVQLVYVVGWGVGIWGINVPIAWAFAIVNFFWWVGIGHAGTMISAMLLVSRQKWRNSINRFAEAMTLFGLTCAGLFPVFHLGRPWFAYWLVPYPSEMGVWPQYRSPLNWDAIAVATYFTVSLIFWYMGAIPDLATMRDKAENKLVRRIYGVMCFGWSGTAKEWADFHSAYLVIGGIATALVCSVHSVIGLDLALGQIPGWHSTILPPYFVAEAIYSGLAMVLTIAIPLRHFYKLEKLVTLRHLDNLAKVALVTCWLVIFAYVMEQFMAYYSGDKYEAYNAKNRLFGAYNFTYWTVVGGSFLAAQLLWLRKVRATPWLLFCLAQVIQIGLWSEDFMVVVVSLQRDFLPSSWGMYYPTFWDVAFLAGSLGLFLTLYLLLIRTFPMVPMSECKDLLHRKRKGRA